MNDLSQAQSPTSVEKPSTTRPGFAKAFPDSPAINELLDAFEKGNYAFVKARSEQLLTSSEDLDEKKAAQELLLRLKPDPLAVRLLLGSVALLVLLTVWTYLNHHH